MKWKLIICVVNLRLIFYFHFYDFSRLQILIFASLARYMLKLEEHRIKTAERKEA